MHPLDALKTYCAPNCPPIDIFGTVCSQVKVIQFVQIYSRALAGGSWIQIGEAHLFGRKEGFFRDLEKNLHTENTCN